MRLNNSIISLIASFVFLSPAAGRAATLFDSGIDDSLWTNAIISDTSGFLGRPSYVAARATLTADSVLTGVQWTGHYGSGAAREDLVVPNHLFYFLAFLADGTDGAPGTNLIGSGLDWSATPTAFLSPAGAPVYEYIGEILPPAPLALAAGDYWFSIVAVSDPRDPYWAWGYGETGQTNVLAGSTEFYSDWGLVPINATMDFTLIGEVPEPPTALLILSAGLLLARKGRRRKIMN